MLPGFLENLLKSGNLFYMCYGSNENRTGYHPVLVQLFSWYHGMHSSWETKQRDSAVVGSFTPVCLFVYGDNQFANLSVPFQNATPLDTQPPGALSSPNLLSNFSQSALSSDLSVHQRAY